MYLGAGRPFQQQAQVIYCLALYLLAVNRLYHITGMQACFLRRAVLVHIAYVYIITLFTHAGAYSAVLAGGHKFILLNVGLGNVIGIWIQAFQHGIYACLYQFAGLYRVYIVCIQFFEQGSVYIQIFGYLEVRVAGARMYKEKRSGGK